MECLKQKERTIFSLFNVYSCNMCKMYKDDETILIGKNHIKIYPIFKGCKYRDIKPIDYCFNKRLRVMLYEVSMFLTNNLFIWLDDDTNMIDDNMMLFDSMLDENINIIIIY